MTEEIKQAESQEKPTAPTTTSARNDDTTSARQLPNEAVTDTTDAAESANSRGAANSADSGNSTGTKAPEVTAKKKKTTRFNHVWWLPLIALLIVTYIAITRYTSQGPIVTIHFNSAEGLAVEKTKVRYKDLDIGKVVKVDLDDTFQGVTISVRMDKKAEGMLRQNTQFWVVKPRFSITQVSGLNTLLSGNYLSIEPDKNPNSDYKYEFEGLEEPPIVTQNEPGLKITVLANKASSLYPGTAVYYKGMEVGTVNRVYFSPDYLWVKADIFIKSPHDTLIHSNTKFWATSGFSIDASTDGIAVEMESVESLIAGGITFETPVQLNHLQSEKITNGTEFILYGNKKRAFEKNSGRKHHYVTYFDNSVKGLEIGAPVSIRGINIGKVKDIQLLFDAKNNKTRIPVLFEIYESRLALINTEDTEIDIEKISRTLIHDGLRTQLETANLLTGTKQIALVMADIVADADKGAQHSNEESEISEMSAPSQLEIDSITGYPILPSTPQNFDAITASVSTLINKVNRMPLEEITQNLNNLLKNADNTVSSLDINTTLKHFNALLKDTTGLSKDAKTTIKSLNKTLTKLSRAVEKSLSGFSPDAPLYFNMNKTLKKLNETLQSVKSITDLLERKPDALIFGE